MKIKSILILLLFCMCIVTDLKADELYFRNYTNKHGLSHNSVFCSLQDKKGFMWFGTEDGLNRFDGYSFKIYRHNSYQPESLPHNRINDLFEDSNGNLWICTSRYTCLFDETNETFIPLRLSTESLHPEHFFKIEEDKNGYIWFLGYNRIVKYLPSDESFVQYDAEDYFYPADISINQAGVPFFCSSRDLYLFNPATEHFEQIPVLSQEEKSQYVHLSKICEIPNIGVLIGTDRAGLKLWTYADRQIQTIVADTQVRDIISSEDGDYWIASESGLYIYNAMNKSVRNLTKSLVNEFALADNAVYSITKSREGGIWAGTFFGGISYLPNNHLIFKRYIGGKTHPQLLGNAIREICPDDYGNLWLGTEDNGINQYHLESGEITNFSLNNSVHPLSATNIHGLYAEGSKLWIGTYNNGIDVMDIPSGKIIRRYTQENTNGALNNDFILCFARTKNAGMLIGTGSSVVHFDDKAETFSNWNDINGLVRQIYEDTFGHIWIASTEGAYRYVPEEDSLYQYIADWEKNQGLGDNSITSIFEDSKGRIWITTVNGMSLYNSQIDDFNRITAENGLPSNIIYRILEDDNQLFWLTTANGLVHFNPETYAMRTYSYRDGLHETQFNYSSAYRSPEGNMYMGTINGMISFNPKEFKDDTFVPPVYISHIEFPGVHVRKGSQTSETALASGLLKLPYNQSSFTIGYGALNYTSPEAIQYAYMLEGADNTWVTVNQNREVNFANLSPGNYTFKVRSTNSSGIWQNNEAQLDIVIVPPFWATGWALFVYLLLIGFCVLIWYNYKKRQLINKHRMNQEIFESKKEKELYDAKIQFFTFITHEIRTPLTLIKAPLEKIIRSGDGTPETQKNLNTIDKNTQRLLDLSNQLLDFRKTESKGFKLNFVETDISMWMESIINRYRPVIEKEKKDFTIELPSDPFMADIDRDAFSKIIDNLLTNAIKYSEQVIYLKVSADREEKSFFVSICNDGNLIPPGEQDKIFSPFYRVKETENMPGSGIGLSLAYSLTEFHHGMLAYSQTPNSLNCFTVTLPIHQETIYQIPFVPEADSGEEASSDENGKPVLLVVEDQPDMRQFIKNELEEKYYIVEAENGRIGLDRLGKYNVSLIISDVMMPVMDGFAFCNAVKNDVNYSHIPFIILTAQHNLQSHLEGLNNGADAYIEKPFSLELLHGQIENLLRNREMINRTYQQKPLTESSTLAASPVDNIFLQKINDYLAHQLTNESLSVEMLAAEMNMSTSSLYRKIKGLSGVSPVDFIRIYRLKKAIELMQLGENRINEIAYKTGFSSPAYFSTCFQKQYGKSPSEFIRDSKK